MKGPILTFGHYGHVLFKQAQYLIIGKHIDTAVIRGQNFFECLYSRKGFFLDSGVIYLIATKGSTILTYWHVTTLSVDLCHLC